MLINVRNRLNVIEYPAKISPTMFFDIFAFVTQCVYVISELLYENVGVESFENFDTVAVKKAFEKILKF